MSLRYLGTKVELLLSRPETQVNRGEMCTPLNFAVERGHAEVVKLLLRHSKIEVNPANTLFVAAQMGHAEVTSLLLEKGAHVNQATSDGASPLFIAVEMGHAEVTSLLLEKGAHVNQADNDGASPLYIAVENGHAE
jgi:ankyrin repeat protein